MERTINNDGVRYEKPAAVVAGTPPSFGVLHDCIFCDEYGNEIGRGSKTGHGEYRAHYLDQNGIEMTLDTGNRDWDELSETVKTQAWAPAIIRCDLDDLMLSDASGILFFHRGDEARKHSVGAIVTIGDDLLAIWKTEDSFGTRVSPSEEEAELWILSHAYLPPID